MNIVRRLKELGVSKWFIAKYMGVSWNTVNSWDKDVHKPKMVNETMLKLLLKQVEERGM